VTLPSLPPPRGGQDGAAERSGKGRIALAVRRYIVLDCDPHLSSPFQAEGRWGTAAASPVLADLAQAAPQGPLPLKGGGWVGVRSGPSDQPRLMNDVVRSAGTGAFHGVAGPARSVDPCRS
jgi:hypothetical protein